MNDKELKQLLEAFYSGATTEKEEQLLKEFFLNSETVPEKWETDRKCFLALYDEQDIPLPEGIEKRLEQKINELSCVSQPRSAKRILYWIGSAAAIALLCIGIFINEIRLPENHTIADTYTDPMEAAQAAEEILTFMSLQLNKGIEQIIEAEQEIYNINKSIFEQLKD